VGKLLFAATTLMTLVLLFAPGAVADDLVSKETRFGFENNGDPSIPNCTPAAYSNFPAPEFVNVRLRVDADL
jgi:hypothetical protein